MYRTAARRLLPGAAVGKSNYGSFRLFNPRTPVTGSRFCTSANPQSISNQNPSNQNQIPHVNVNPTLNQSDSIAISSSSTSSSSSSSSSWSTSSKADKAGQYQHHRERRIPTVEYQEEQARVLQASLHHVTRLGWTEEALIAGARDAGISPAIAGSFPRKEAALVEFFMDECLLKLFDRIDSGEDLQNLVASERISKLVRIRLEMQAPYISKWAQALSIQAHPSNVPTSFKQRAALLDEIWHAAGDETSAINWYLSCTVLGGIYSTTEIYMLTDSSPDFCDTWAFLDHRVKDAFELKKTIQEAQYLAEAVGAGMGNSLQGFVKKVFQG